VSHGSPPSWERLLWCLLAAVIGLEVLASLLLRLLGPIVVLAIVATLLRLIWRYTQL